MTAARTFRAMRVGVDVSVRRVLAEPGGLVVSMFVYILVVGVLGSLWRAAAGANGGAVVGYSAVALSWYIAASEVVTIPVDYRMIERTGDDIASGSVAVELLRPVPVLAVRVAGEMGRILPRLACCGAVGVVMTLLVAGAPPDLGALTLAVPALFLALSCNLLGQHVFAAAAFWIRDARSAWFLYQKLVFVLGGMLLPFEVLPDGMAAVARLLPFMAMAYVPARLASGHFEPHLLAVQLFWLVVVAGLAAAVFRAGEQRLQTVGG